MTCLQVTSKRLLDKHVNVEEIAPVALRQACTFASVLQVGAKPDTLKADLLEWWAAKGRDLLFSNIAFDEDFSDEEDGVGQQEETSLEKTELSVLELCIGSCQKAALITKELAQMEKEKDWTAWQDDFEKDDEQSEEEEDVDENKRTESRTRISADSVFTLADVLGEASFTHYIPDSEDYVARLLARARKLIAPMQSLTAMVRVNEGILSRACVVGLKRRANVANQMEHALALARRAFQCTAERQSRHAQWQGFVDRFFVEMKAAKTNTESNESQESHAKKISKLGPSTSVLDSGERQYQLLVVRPLSAGDGCGGLRFGVPISVWRCGKSMKASSKHEKLMPASQAPASLATSVHVALLMPAKSKDPNGEVIQILVGTFLRLKIKMVQIDSNFLTRIV